MICVTGAEPSTRLLAERLAAHARFPLQEARLDRLEALDDDTFALLRQRPGLVVTCRRREEGGGFRGSEQERAAVLRRALAGAPAYLDVELAADAELRRELFLARGATRLVTSSHRFEPASPATLRELARALDAAPGDVTKLAVAVEDAAELEPLLALANERGDGRPAIRIGMGPAGLASRALYGRFGSPFTYVTATGSQPVAPGQLDVATAEAWRVARAAELTPLALLGGAAVLRSPGPRVYNRVFSARALPFVYLPVVTTRPLEALALLERLGFAGASVTMPAKEALVPRLDSLDADARAVGAVNTVRLARGERLGSNTDVAAVAALLADVPPGARALVLGAGGAARAAVAALRTQGAQIVLASRDRARAEALAAAFALGAGAVVDWSRRAEIDFAVLVHTTPLGADGATDPLGDAPRDRRDWRGRRVLDAVLSDEPTPLLGRAAAGGARVHSGKEWWLRQGALQMRILTGATFSVDELRAAWNAPEPGGASP